MMKRAYWIKRTHLFLGDEYICSSCGSSTDEPYKECPFCDASMKGLKADPFDADEMEMINEIFDE